MKYFALLLIISIFISCNTEPQPLVAGKDECYFCKMPVADLKFGAEIITTKGKFYKFDDTGCMISFLKANELEQIKEIFTVDYSASQKLLNVKEAIFLISENLRTPMNSGIAGFASRQQAEYFHKEFPGGIMNWEQLRQKQD